MLRTVLKGAAYSKAPRATFAVLHPREALELKKLPYDLRHAYAPRVAALMAVLVALPLGIAIGRVMERRARQRAARRAEAEGPRVAQRQRARRDRSVGDVPQPV